MWLGYFHRHRHPILGYATLISMGISHIQCHQSVTRQTRGFPVRTFDILYFLDTIFRNLLPQNYTLLLFVTSTRSITTFMVQTHIGTDDTASYFNVTHMAHAASCGMYHTLLYLYTVRICILYIHYTIYNIYNIFPCMPVHPLIHLYAPVHSPYIHIPPIHLYVPCTFPIHPYTPMSLCPHMPAHSQHVHMPPYIYTPHTSICPQVHMSPIFLYCPYVHMHSTSIHLLYIHMPPSICTLPSSSPPYVCTPPICLYKLYNCRPVI